MKKIVFTSLLLSLIILTSCAAKSVPTASPSKTATASSAPSKSPVVTQTPKATVKPTSKQSFKLTNEAANAFLKIISNVIVQSEKSSYAEEFKQATVDEWYSGTLFDLDSDGQDELIMVYPTDDGKYYYYEIYTYKFGNSILLKKDKLFTNAGGPLGGLSIVNYNNEKYLCVWNVDAHSADTSIYTVYKYELFTYKNSALLSAHKFDFTYLETKDKRLPLDKKPGVLKDGKEIPFEEFIKTQDAFENPVNVLCKVGKSEPPYRLRQLYEDIKDR